MFEFVDLELCICRFPGDSPASASSKPVDSPRTLASVRFSLRIVALAVQSNVQNKNWLLIVKPFFHDPKHSCRSMVFNLVFNTKHKAPTTLRPVGPAEPGIPCKDQFVALFRHVATVPICTAYVPFLALQNTLIEFWAKLVARS